MGLVSFLVWANETVGSIGAASPAAAASVRASRRDTRSSDAGDRLKLATFGAVRSKFIVSLLIQWIERHARLLHGSAHAQTEFRYRRCSSQIPAKRSASLPLQVVVRNK